MIQIAQIGCGYWGPNLLRNLHANSNCCVKWLVEESPERIRFVQSRYPEIPCTSRMHQVFEDSQVDAVVIATPAGTHAELVRLALESGKHVLVEKPLALSTVEARSLGELAEKNKTVLMVGHTFLYSEPVNYLRSLVSTGELGKLYYASCQRLNLGQVRSDVNAWWNLAPHDVSILLYLMEDQVPCSVSARGSAFLQPGVEDVVFADLVWENRVTAHVHLSWLDPMKTRKIVLVGSRKMVIYDDVSEYKVTIFDKGVEWIPRIGENMDYDHVSSFQMVQRSGDVYIPKIENREPLQTEISHFLDCIRTGSEPRTGPRHAIDVVKVLEAGQKSLEKNGVLTSIEN